VDFDIVPDLNDLEQEILITFKYWYDCDFEADITHPSYVAARDNIILRMQQNDFLKNPLRVTVISQFPNDPSFKPSQILLEERHKVEQHQQYFDELKHQLQMLMKDAERAVFTGGSVTWKKSQDSISLDSKSLLKQHPEYLQQFPQTKVGTRRFQIYPNGG
jgi:hypothetical protein